MKRVVHIGEGRHIEVEEGVLRKAPPPPPEEPKVKFHRPKNYPKAPTIKRRDRRVFRRKLPRPDMPDGFWEWRELRNKQVLAVSPTRGKIVGQSQGFSKTKAEEVWARARELAERDMANIKKADLNIDEFGEEALRTTLEIMRGPPDIKTKLAAARQLLEWTKAKPAAKSEVTVNSAEAWLASLADDEDESDPA